MNSHVITTVVLFLFCFLPRMCAATSPVDDVYRQIADGQTEHAVALAFEMEVPETSTRSPDVLLARLDALIAKHALNGAAGTEYLASLKDLKRSNRNTAQLQVLFHIWSDIEKRDFESATSEVQRWLSNHVKAQPDLSGEIEFADATAKFSLNQLDAAEAQARRALKSVNGKKELRARFREIGTDWLLANIYLARSNYDAALPYLRSAHDIAHAQFGMGTDLSVRVDIAYSSVHQRIGNYSENYKLCDDAMAATRALHGDKNSLYARALACVVGALYTAANDVKGRAPLGSLKSLLGSDVSLTTEDRQYMEALVGVIEMTSIDENVPDGLEHVRRAYALRVEDSPHARFNAMLLGNVAEGEYRVGQTRESAMHYKQAMAQLEKVEGDQSYGLVFLLHGTAGVAIKERRFLEAEASLTRALGMARRIWPNGSFESAALEYALALSQRGAGKLNDAFESAKRASDLQLPVLETITEAAAERQSAAFHDQLVPSTALLVTLAAEDTSSDKIEIAWSYVMRERRLVGRRLAQRMLAARVAKDPVALRLLNDWQTASRAVTGAWLGQSPSATTYSKMQEELENAERAFWSRASRLKLHDAIDVPPLDVLRRNLPPDGQLIAMTEGLSEDPARTVRFKRGHDQLPEMWFAFTLTSDGKPAVQRVGAIAEETAKIRAWYSLARDPRSNLTLLQDRGEAVARSFLELADSGKHKIFFLPEGEAFRLNLSALPWKSGYFVESSANVQLLTHESDLLSEHSKFDGNVVLAGAPAFIDAKERNESPNRQTCEQLSSNGFVPIPHAKDEILSLQNVFASATKTFPEIAVLLGKEATANKVVSKLPGATVIHLATHAFSMDEQCTPANSRGLAVVSNTDSTSVPPATASALAFAPGEKRDDDALASASILTSEQLATIDLSRARWLVLSACDSGIGPIERGEGVFGMRRALRTAGVQTITMSLWEADDEATSALMGSLYRNRFVELNDVPTALGSAMRKTISDRRRDGLSDRPYYWGAFVSEGAWR